MSMIGNFLLVSDDEISALLAAPAGVHDFLERRVYQVERAADHLDVDKAWHALHYLLTGTAWEGSPPLDFIAQGGTEIGDEDVGYGPARVLRPTELSALDQALGRIAKSDLASRYDAKQMEGLEIYPGGWSELDSNNEEEFGYFSGAYEDLRALVAKGAQRGSGMLIWLN